MTWQRLTNVTLFQILFTLTWKWIHYAEWLMEAEGEPKGHSSCQANPGTHKTMNVLYNSSSYLELARLQHQMNKVSNKRNNCCKICWTPVKQFYQTSFFHKWFFGNLSFELLVSSQDSIFELEAPFSEIKVRFFLKKGSKE